MKAFDYKMLKSNDNLEILVELYGSGGIQDVAFINRQRLAQISAEALDEALSTIGEMAKRAARTMASVESINHPDIVEMTFGLKLTTDAQALIAKVGSEAQIEVKLIWNLNSTNPH